jgi:hypothetical protein
MYPLRYLSTLLKNTMHPAGQKNGKVGQVFLEYHINGTQEGVEINGCPSKVLTILSPTTLGCHILLTKKCINEDW